MKTTSFIQSDKLNMALLETLMRRPALYAKSEDFIWTDDHVGQAMLAFHLDPSHDRASYRPSLIDAQCAWITEKVQGAEGKALLDMGCGPGLYCRRFTRKGFTVTGMDFNDHTLAYARKRNKEDGLSIDYLRRNYVNMDFVDRFDVVTLISRDFSALVPEDRVQVLANIHRALKAGGYFIFDLSSTEEGEGRQESASVSASVKPDFWSAKPHMLIEQHLIYPETTVLLEKYILIEVDGRLRNFHNWLTLYTEPQILALLKETGFSVVEMNPLLSESTVSDSQGVLGFIARKE